MTDSNIKINFDAIKDIQMELKELKKSKLDVFYAGLFTIISAVIIFICYTSIHNELLIINNSIHSELGSIHNELANIHEEFDKIDQRFIKIDHQFDKIDERFNKMDERFNKMDLEQKELTKCVLLLQNPDVKITGIECNLAF